jgi:hypothetical protein
VLFSTGMTSSGSETPVRRRDANGVKHLTVVERVEQRFLGFRNGKCTVGEKPFARQAKVIHQQAERCGKLSGVAGLVQNMRQL